MQVVGKFILGGKTPIWARYKGEEVQGVQVSLRASQGEPFGEATPSGGISMSIHNPAAAQVFLEAPEEAEFYVTFERAEAVDLKASGQVADAAASAEAPAEEISLVSETDA